MDIGLVEVLASASLVLVAVGLSLWKGLGIERSLLWSATRAAIQLLAVGVLFRFIFDSSQSMLWAVLWVTAMLLLSAETIGRRAKKVGGVRVAAITAMGVALIISLGVIFGLNVFELEPVTLVVTAGITLGNTVPAVVLGVNTAAKAFSEHPARTEGLLALGMEPSKVSRFLTPEAVRQALIPQIERTKVVGLIALPGAMTGMLLAGSDAISAVLVQIVILYLILGSVSIAVVSIATTVAMRAFTPDARLAAWVTAG
ncbi:MAG: ABC transporter permease [Acidimicrobiia bacterium]